MKKLLIGTSLSLCLSDMMDGTVKAEDVDLILSATTFLDLESAVASEEKWAAPSARIALLRTIWSKVTQPRLLHPRCTGHQARPPWIEVDSLADAFRALDQRDPDKVDNYEELGFVTCAEVVCSSLYGAPLCRAFPQLATPHAVSPENGMKILSDMCDNTFHPLLYLLAGRLPPLR